MALTGHRRARGALVPAGLALALAAGCGGGGGGGGRACPMIRGHDGITIDAAPFAAAHPRARRLCVGSRCVPLTAKPPEPQGITVPYHGAPLRIRVVVAAADGSALVDRTVSARAHRIAAKGCDTIARQGRVTVAADGSVRAS
ncbi:hypothetical protein [Actinomadura violacea]|uniref:Lipoprotein n=1 Tax=Actinomadura violacea TaxID=2819934 RepID=A0ABS3S1E7_9ACTN|nr:hypothetical protein [Actinomadura violacea]MBO2462830.1 hypothetical protein [Actinomadura violacea]